MVNYHQRKFKVLKNSPNGEVADDLIFEYQQEGNILSCQYAGGEIKQGQLLGKVNPAGALDFVYQQINAKGELRTGRCQSKPELMPNGKIRLHEEWQWTSGDLSKGHSILEEIS